MELFLNALWLALSLAAVGLCLRQRRSALRSGHREVGRSLLALGCVLVLFFPVISLTDDLHFTPQLVEESASRKVGLNGANLKASAGSHDVSLFAPAGGPAPGVPDSIKRLLPVRALLTLARVWHASAPGRAPPAASSL